MKACCMTKNRDALLSRRQSIYAQVSSGGSVLANVLGSSTGYCTAEQAFDQYLSVENYDQASAELDKMDNAVAAARLIGGSVEAGVLDVM